MGIRNTHVVNDWLDCIANTPLQDAVLSKQAVIVVSGDLKQILWANTSGASLFGGMSVLEILDTRFDADHPFLRQLSSAVRQLSDESIYRGFRIADEGRSRLLQCKIGTLDGSDFSQNEGAEKAIILECANPALSDMKEHELAELMLENITPFYSVAAICDEYGLVIAATDEFADIDIESELLDDLAKYMGTRQKATLGGETTQGETQKLDLYKFGTNPLRFLLLADQTVELADQADRAVEIDADLDEPHEEAIIEGALTNDATTDDITDHTGQEDGPLSLLLDEDKCDEELSKDVPDGLIETVEEDKFRLDELDNSALIKRASDDDFDTPVEKEAPDNHDADSDFAGFDDFVFDTDSKPIRFAWTISPEQVFTSVSPELAKAVGPNAADIVGRKWCDIATVFGFDDNREIHALLKKHDTWSGKSVLWPVQGTDLQVPVDLAALPSFSSGRDFDGFRGFGIVRMLDTIVDPEEFGLALKGPTTSKSSDEPVLETKSIQQDQDIVLEDESSVAVEKETNIINLRTHRHVEKPRQAEDDYLDQGLSNGENQAFDEIGRKLRDGMGISASNLKQKQSELEQTPLQDQIASLKSDDVPQPQDSPDQEAVGDEAENDERVLEHQTRLSNIDTTLLEKLPVPVMVYRGNETLYVNPEFLSVTGYSSLDELHDAGGIDALFKNNDLGKIEDDSETVLRDRDGAQMAVTALLQSVPWDKQQALLLSFRQPRHNSLPANEKIVLDMMRVSELQNILDTATDGIVILDKDGNILSINHSAQTLLDRQEDNTNGKFITEIFATESHDEVTQYLDNLVNPQINSILRNGCEAIGIKANGGMIPLYITIGKIGESEKFCVIMRDMTPWKKSREELIEAKKKAEEASDQKTEFLARISHEIRTPLNAIIGFSDVMIEERFGPVDNDRYREYLRDINRSGIHVLDLINDLLDISKIEAGKMELSFEAVDLNRIVGETVALLQPQANGDRVIIRTSLSRAVPKVVADARSIRQIVLNLVSNAIKFTEANGQVIVSTVYEGNGEVALRVRDTGRGMTEDEVRIALKPFRQINSISDKKNQQGTGLGLPLTKALVEANKAYLDIESEPGEGTIVHIQFPTQRVLAD